MTSEILGGNSSEGIGNSVPVSVLETKDFNEKFTPILRSALNLSQSGPISDTMRKSIDSIREMTDQTLAASLMTFDGNIPMIQNENHYVRALCNETTIRQQKAVSDLF